jgi:hypothetical protein
MEVCADVIAMSYLRPPTERRFEKRSVDRIVNVATCHRTVEIRLGRGVLSVGFRVSGFGFRVSGFGFQVSGSRMMDQGEGCRQTSPENADE